MVLPEIEEEDEDLNQRHSKLSLTSLLLGNQVYLFKMVFIFLRVKVLIGGSLTL